MPALLRCAVNGQRLRHTLSRLRPPPPLTLLTATSQYHLGYRVIHCIVETVFFLMYLSFFQLPASGLWIVRGLKGSNHHPPPPRSGPCRRANILHKQTTLQAYHTRTVVCLVFSAALLMLAQGDPFPSRMTKSPTVQHLNTRNAQNDS